MRGVAEAMQMPNSETQPEEMDNGQIQDVYSLSLYNHVSKLSVTIEISC